MSGAVPRPLGLRTAATLGARFALGSREAWGRSLLTAVGVGLGVALLLLAASVPTALAARDARAQLRDDTSFGEAELPAGEATLLVGDASTSVGGQGVRGRLLEAEGPAAPVPPGLDALPAPGEVVVSPALAEALEDPGASALRARLPYRVVGTIGDEGLLGPGELAFYAGDDRLTAGRGGLERRIDHVGDPVVREPLDPVLALLLAVGVLVLLLPVVVFVSTATRFGAERRNRRLAALRLVGLDAAAARGTAAAEAAAAALLGLVVGGALFAAGRSALGLVSVQGVSVFPADARPAPALVAVVVLGVPLLAVGASLLGLRGVVLEPLGVVRSATVPRRRLWWRLLLPAAGAGLLAAALASPVQGALGGVAPRALAALLLLTGVVTVLPWAVDAVVRRLGRGPFGAGGPVGVGWLLAVRRLQVGGATSARVVSGVAVAAAGTIALQMLFAGLASSYTTSTGADPERADVVAATYGLDADGAAAAQAAVAAVPGAAAVRTTTAVPLSTGADEGLVLLVGDCAALAEVAVITGCSDGDAFVADPAVAPAPGTEVELGGGGRWTVPAGAAPVEPRPDPTGATSGAALLATPGAVDLTGAAGLSTTSYLRAGAPGTPDRVVTALLAVDPLPVVRTLAATDEADRFAGIRTGLLVGGLAVLLTIGASLVVSGSEQLAERRRVHAVLGAMGTPRSALSWALLLGSAVPVGLGTGLAVVVGTGLGALLLAVTGAPVRLDPAGTATTAALSVLVVLAATAAMLPGLRRSLRADGLWSE